MSMADLALLREARASCALDGETCCEWSPVTLHVGDCLEVLKGMPDNSVDLVMTSPPYEDCRTYGIDFNHKGQAWVDWAVERYLQCVRVSRGLVAWVVDGKTSQYRWSATPALLMADLHRAGVWLRKPPVYHRSGIPGSGGPDWLRNDWEFVVCASKGKLPWSDNKACGKAPVCPPGGDPTNRTKTGKRVRVSGAVEGAAKDTGSAYQPPLVANPGNVISLAGGHLGSKFGHMTEAPYPLALAEFFVKSFCPPGGVVLDPFLGSGTTAHAAIKHGRSVVGIDIRRSQIDLTRERLAAEGVAPNYESGAGSKGEEA